MLCFANFGIAAQAEDIVWPGPEWSVAACDVSDVNSMRGEIKRFPTEVPGNVPGTHLAAEAPHIIHKTSGVDKVYVRWAPGTDVTVVCYINEFIIYANSNTFLEIIAPKNTK